MRDFAGFALLMMGACSTGLGDQVAQEAARSVVTLIVEDKLPGTNATQVSDCVINNATSSEILDLAADAATGADNGTIQTVLTIAQRPDTVSCLLDAALANGSPLDLLNI